MTTLKAYNQSEWKAIVDTYELQNPVIERRNPGMVRVFMTGIGRVKFGEWVSNAEMYVTGATHHVPPMLRVWIYTPRYEDAPVTHETLPVTYVTPVQFRAVSKKRLHAAIASS
jgi:hypothetical protein